MKFARCLCLLLALLQMPAAAQDPGMNEVMITGSRIRRSNLGGEDSELARPAIALRRTADFAVMYVSITGDTREADRRREEIFTMVRSAIERSASAGVELSTGNFIVEALTLANYRNLTPVNDGRPDSDRVTFLVKVRLGAETDGAAALRRIEQFVRSVPASGRAEMRGAGELTLSVVAPDQYRGQILDLIAADSRAVAARFGPNYAVDANGLDRPVEWMRATLTEVFLYVPYTITVRPADSQN
jgi:hypothetical protein